MGQLSKKILTKLMGFLFGVIAIGIMTTAFGLSYDAGGVDILPPVLSVAGMILMPQLPMGVLAYTFVSVGKTVNNPGRPAGKLDQIIIFKWEDVATMPARDTGGVRIAGNIVFDTGMYAIEVYVTPSSIKISETGEGEDDAKGFIQSLECEKPGDDLALSEFLENNINSNLGVIVRFCDGRTPRLLGTPCVPLQMVPESQNDKEANKVKMTFKSTQRGPVIAHYAGAIPTLYAGSGSGAGV